MATKILEATTWEIENGLAPRRIRKQSKPAAVKTQEKTPATTIDVVQLIAGVVGALISIPAFYFMLVGLYCFAD